MLEKRERLQPPLLLLTWLMYMILFHTQAAKLSAFTLAPSLSHMNKHVGRRANSDSKIDSSPYRRTFSPSYKHIQPRLYMARKQVFHDIDSVCEALEIYREIYGDTLVPNTFIVPEEAPWPDRLMALRLGKRLETYRSTDLDSDHPDVASRLKQSGYDVDIPMPTEFDLIVQGLSIYRSKYGDLRVPVAFTVPTDDHSWPVKLRGLKLGSRIATMKSTGRYVKDHPERKKILDQMGFEWSAYTRTQEPADKKALFQKIFQALQHYKNIYGDLDIPYDFVVPTTQKWPDDLWGLQLGEYSSVLKQKNDFLFHMPQREEDLLSIGFTFETSGSSSQEERFQRVYNALVIYKELHGDMLVPQNFTVPSQPPWRPEAWGLRLGVRVNTLRQGMMIKYHPERKAMLDELGFVWSIKKGAENEKRKAFLEEEERIEDEIRQNTNTFIYEPQYPTSKDPPKRKRKLRFDEVEDVPQSEEMTNLREEALKSLVITDSQSADAISLVSNLLEEEKASLRVAAMANEITAKMGTYSYLEDRVSPAGEVGYVHYLGVSYRYDNLMAEKLMYEAEALEYSQSATQRDIAMLDGFMFAEDIGESILQRHTPSQEILLRQYGYRVFEFDGWTFMDVYECLKLFKEKHGNVLVPVDMVVAEEDTPHDYPDMFVGLPLGMCVRAIKNGDADGFDDSGRKKALDSLGFEWGDTNYILRYRFFPMLHALMMRRHLTAVVTVPPDFIVPENKLYPVWMRGMQLGRMVDMCRQQQNVLREKFPDRFTLLNKLGFEFWLPPYQYDKKGDGVPATSAHPYWWSVRLPQGEYKDLRAAKSKREKMRMLPVRYTRKIYWDLDPNLELPDVKPIEKMNRVSKKKKKKNIFTIEAAKDMYGDKAPVTPELNLNAEEIVQAKEEAEESDGVDDLFDEIGDVDSSPKPKPKPKTLKAPQLSRNMTTSAV